MKSFLDFFVFIFIFLSYSIGFASETGKLEQPKINLVLPPIVSINPEIEAVLKRPPPEVQRPNLKSEWTKMRGTEDKDFYINIGEIYRSNNILEIPALFDYKKKSQQESASETATVKIDCLNSQWTISNLMGWSKQMGDGQTMKLDNRQLEWSAIDTRNSGDVFTTLQSDFCKIQILGFRPQLTNGRAWAPMVGKTYEEQITRLFRSHIVLKEKVTPESFLEVLISVDTEGVISDTKIISRGGDPLWEEAVISSVKIIGNRYQSRSPRGYGNSGKIEIRFKP